MRFRALFIKEWRESAPFVMVAMLLVALLGFGLIRLINPWVVDSGFVRLWYQGREIHAYYRYPFSGLSAILWLGGIGLGLCLGVRHFWMPSFSKTWEFLVHRSMSRGRILTVKLLCAALGILVCLEAVWTLLYIYSHYLQQEMIRPPYARVYFDGCIYIGFGLVVYLATALAGLESTRWYTSRFFSFIWALFAMGGIVSLPLFAALLWLTGAVIVLTVLVWDRFNQREFA